MNEVGLETYFDAIRYIQAHGEHGFAAVIGEWVAAIEERSGFLQRFYQTGLAQDQGNRGHDPVDIKPIDIREAMDAAQASLKAFIIESEHEEFLGDAAYVEFCEQFASDPLSVKLGGGVHPLVRFLCLLEVMHAMAMDEKLNQNEKLRQHLKIIFSAAELRHGQQLMLIHNSAHSGAGRAVDAFRTSCSSGI